MVRATTNAEERQQRFEDLSAELDAITRGKAGCEFSQREGELPEALDRLEFEEGIAQLGESP
jgi:hypothetical protein